MTTTKVTVIFFVRMKCYAAEENDAILLVIKMNALGVCVCVCVLAAYWHASKLKICSYLCPFRPYVHHARNL